jgi:hypothetical protein
MATLRVTNLRGRTGNASPTLPDGAIVTGVTTTTTLAVSGVATAASSVIAGIITANSTGIDVGAGIITATSFVGSGEGLTGVASTDNIITSTASTFANINSTGIITATSRVTVGTAVTVNGDGLNVIGIVTATSFEGSGSGLTGLNIPAGFTELDAALFN